MVLSTRIANGRVYYKGQFIESAVHIDNGLITSIGREFEKDHEETFDAGGYLVLPGLIDVHSHLRDGALSYKEDFRSGTQSAIAGGFTTVLDMPNSIPPVNSVQRLVDRIKVAEDRGIFCDVGFYATPSSPEIVEGLVNAGAIGIKAYMAKTIEGTSYSTFDEISSLINACASSKIICSVHAEDPQHLTEFKGSTAKEHWSAHPPIAEIEAIKNIIHAAKSTKGAVHVAHISTSKGLELVERAKALGVNITCEGTPHHSMLTTERIDGSENRYIVEPPIRSQNDMVSIRRGIKSRLISILATDHAPHSIEEKGGVHPPPGFPGFETALAVFMKMVYEGDLTLETVVSGFSDAPSMRFGLGKTGKIEEGYEANITIFDPRKDWTVRSDAFLSKAKYSPFEGFRFKGKVYATFIRGRLGYLDENILYPSLGRVIKRNRIGF